MMNAMLRRHLTDTRRVTLKASLLARRDQLVAQLATHQGGESRVEHAHAVLTQDAAAQRDSDREIDLALSDFDSQTLAEVSRALRRLNSFPHTSPGIPDMTTQPLFHAVVELDHQQALVLQFDADHVESQKVKSSNRYTRQHGSAVRTEHAFFGHVCDALEGIAEVLVTGNKTALADFKHYADKHRPETARHIVGYETTDHPTENQLVALARQFLWKHDRMAGTPTAM